jgi:tellurite resistance protein TerC
MKSAEVIFFSGFILIILLILVVDLGVFNGKKKSHIIKFKEAIIWTSIWVAFAMAFYFFIQTNGNLIHGVENNAQLKEISEKYEHPIILSSANFDENLIVYNKNLSLEFITGYLIEYALSVDNVFVMVLLFLAFNVQQKYYHRVLFWGILGALIMRFIFIFLSAALIQQFSWILYVFGGLLIYTGVKMFINRKEDEKIETKNHPIVKFATKHFAVFPKYVGNRFWIKKRGKLSFTPLFVVLLVVEFTDLIFAVDSVPAIFSITKDPYIVFFSNIFAIIGLRSLFFLVMNVINIFHYLKIGLSILLTFIGLKMIFHTWLKAIGFTTAHSLYLILLILSVSILASLIFPKKKIEV